MAQADRRRPQLADVRAFLGAVYGADLHAKRIDSLAGAALGVMQSASLAVAMIGQALAQAKGLVTKHAIKQVDRMLSNNGIDVWDSFARWVPHQIGTRQEILVAMDWTDFDHDDQATLALHLVTGHGRAAPLLWLSVWKDELKDRRNDFEDACLRRLPNSYLRAAVSRSLRIEDLAIRSCLPFSRHLALATSSVFAATFTSPTRTEPPGRPPNGWARADAPAS